MLGFFDFHTHTSDFSDGRSDLMTNIRSAELAGMNNLAITDHLLPGNPPRFKNGNSIIEYVDRINFCRDQTSVVLWAGCEDEIQGLHGEISLTAKEYALLDMTMVHLGQFCREVWQTGNELNKEAWIDNLVSSYINVVKSPYLDIVAHPFNVGRHCQAPPGFVLTDIPEDRLDEMALAMVKHDTAFDLMSDMAWWFPNVRVDDFTEQYCVILKPFVRRGVKFSFSSDAHSHQGIGNILWPQRVAKQAGITDDMLVTEIFFKSKR